MIFSTRPKLGINYWRIFCLMPLVPLPFGWSLFCTGMFSVIVTGSA